MVQEGVLVDAVISYLLQVPGSLWPLLGFGLCGQLGQVKASGCQQCLLMCWECSRSPVPGYRIVLTAPLCPQDLLLYNRQAAEQSLCLCCPEPGERGTGVPCLPLTQEEDRKHLPSALGSMRYGWEQGPAFFPFSERRPLRLQTSAGFGAREQVCSCAAEAGSKQRGISCPSS